MPTSPAKPLEHEQAQTASFLNVAAYKFVSLGNLGSLRSRLKERCTELGLRGTILLSQEGINLFLAGVPDRVEELVVFLRQHEPFSDLEVKRSYSAKMPFRRMLVRLKKEIIPCGISTIRPEQNTSAKLAARELKRWLDEGRPVRLLDVRNKYEVDLGTFRGAEQLHLDHFRDFAEAIEQMPKQEKSGPLVMFCTGGIRCEKAGPLMEQAGYREVYQLDGGILKYFEECGGAHWDGSCFVFDGRVALDPELRPTGNLLCFACQAVLTAEDVTSGEFMFGEYCPRCYQTPEQRRLKAMEERQTRIRAIAASQPGSTPYTNVREIHVPGSFDGYSLVDFLCRWQPAIGSDQWHRWLSSGQIATPTGRACHAEQIVRAGECFVQSIPDTVEPPIHPNIELIHEDESLVVVNKPAPLPCHASGRFRRNTLEYILSQAYPREKLRLSHRLDAMTTGVCLLCRKHRAARYVQEQFRLHKVHKLYVARVWGHPEWENIDCTAAISPRAISAGGVRSTDDHGRQSQSFFRKLEFFADGTSLIEARPVSGRTNQIRLHLQHLGHGIVGDKLYERADEAGHETLDASPEEHSGTFPSNSLCLHAASLRLLHPDSREMVTFEAQLPDWASTEEGSTRSSDS